MKVIADTGNEQYYESRAMECIAQARESQTHGEKLNYRRQAVGLLLLALVKSGQNSQTQPG